MDEPVGNATGPRTRTLTVAVLLGVFAGAVVVALLSRLGPGLLRRLLRRRDPG